MLYRLAEAGLSVAVRGPEWHRFFDKTHPKLQVVSEWMGGDDYAKVVNATRINLGFLRKANRDRQTTRSIEIPACRGFMASTRGVALIPCLPGARRSPWPSRARC